MSELPENKHVWPGIVWYFWWVVCFHAFLGHSSSPHTHVEYSPCATFLGECELLILSCSMVEWCCRGCKAMCSTAMAFDFAVASFSLLPFNFRLKTYAHTSFTPYGLMVRLFNRCSLRCSIHPLLKEQAGSVPEPCIYFTRGVSA